MTSEHTDGLFEAADGRLRCGWSGSQEDYQAYHDLEWGRPVADDRRLFEHLVQRPSRRLLKPLGADRLNRRR